MEWNQMLETLAGLQPADRMVWIRGALLVLAAMVAVLLIEWLYFRRAAKSGSWAWMRIMALVMPPVTVAAVLVPTRLVGGPEALGVFYLELFTVVPFLWFGSHIFCARRLKPALTTSEAMTLALSGIAIWTIPVTAFLAAEFDLRKAARAQAEQPGQAVRLVHTVGAVRRFEIPGAGIVLTQSLTAPAGTTLEDVETRQHGPWYPTRGTTQHIFCTSGNDVHLMWSAHELPPQLRLHTRDPQGKLVKSAFVAGSAPKPANGDDAFGIRFTNDGFDPVVPIPRARVFLGFVRPDGTTHQSAPLQAQPGEPARDTCVMPGYTRIAAASEGRIESVHFIFYLSSGKPPLFGEIRRPASLQ